MRSAHFSFFFPRLNKPASFSLPSKVRFSRPLSLLVTSPLDYLQLMCIFLKNWHPEPDRALHHAEGNRRFCSRVLEMTLLCMCFSGHGFPVEGLRELQLWCCICLHSPHTLPCCWNCTAFPGRSQYSLLQICWCLFSYVCYAHITNIASKAMQCKVTPSHTINSSTQNQRLQ